MIFLSEGLTRLKVALALALLAGLTGCAGNYAVGYDDGGVVTGPGVGFYGDFYDRGPYVHAFHDRGWHSRGFVSHGGGRRR